MIFKFVTAANEFADEMEKGDHARLLRMRLRKHEIVIVPGQYGIHSLLKACVREALMAKL